MPSHYPLIDAHTHLGSDSERSERQKKQILSLVCASTPPEAEALLKTAKPYLLPTAGLHPWQAASYFVNDMLPYLTACPVIGEIGMDSVWCDVPLDRQEEVFRAQLAIACQMKKPVILHTKGEEDRSASILPEYPNTYLVHWYSCEEYLDQYRSAAISPSDQTFSGTHPSALSLPASRRTAFSSRQMEWEPSNGHTKR